jgi:hypothetical protein
MIQKPKFTFLGLILMLVLSACDLVMGTPFSHPPTPTAQQPQANTPTLDPQIAIDQAVAETLTAQAQIVEAFAGTAQMGTLIARSVEQTLTAFPSVTPSSTPTASLTPSMTASITPDTIRLTVSADTNCRTGPGTAYTKVGVMLPGQTAEVLGRSSTNDNWIIRLPSDPLTICWLWGQYVTVVGDPSRLPVITPPPTPTPSTYLVEYLSTVTCSGTYGFRFKITGNSSTTWQSYRLVIVDSTTATIKTYADDTFRDLAGCGPFTNELQDLELGEVGYAGNWGAAGTFAYNPAGHNMVATFTLCSQNGLSGACVDKNVIFTP